MLRGKITLHWVAIDEGTLRWYLVGYYVHRNTYITMDQSKSISRNGEKVTNMSAPLVNKHCPEPNTLGHYQPWP